MPPNAPPSTPQADFIPRPQPADFVGTITRLADSTIKLDWTNGFLRFIALSSSFFLLSILWMMLVPEASMGVLRFVQDDTHRGRRVVTGVVALFFMRDIGQSLRGIKARHGMIFVLSGQAVMAVIATIYTLRGELSLAGFAGNVGVFWLSLVSLWTIAQHNQKMALMKLGQVYRPRWGIEAKTFLIPGVAIIMFLTSIGLVTRPDGAISDFIHTQIGLLYYVIVLGWIVLGSGFITLNHIKAKWLFVAVMGYYLFVGLLVGLFAYDPTSISLTFLVSHFVIAVEAFFIILLQTTYSPEG